MSSGDGGKGVEIESAASQVMQIISFNLLLKITQSQVKEGLYGLSHCYCQGVTDLGCIRRAAEEEEELQQILTCWKSLPVRVTGWARRLPWGSPRTEGAANSIRSLCSPGPREETLKCSLVTLALPMVYS